MRTLASAALPTPDELLAENARLRALVEAMEKTARNRDNLIDALKRELLLARRRMFGSVSEKRDEAKGAEQTAFAALDAEAASSEDAIFAEAVCVAQADVATPAQPARSKKAYRPRTFAAELEREAVAVADPVPGELKCPVTGEAMRPLRTETLEVLACERARYFVKRYTRTVYAGPGKTAPVYSPWPADILPRRGVHVSVVAQSLSDRFADHIPYARQCDRLSRLGPEMTVARLCGWADHTANALKPFYELILAEQLKSGYIQYDHTPVDVRDPEKKGATREAAVWAMCAPGSRLVSFRYTKDKTGGSASAGLAGYKGRLQTDGAANFGPAAEAEGVVRLACWAHVRRKFFEAEKAGEKDATPWLDDIGKLFAVERHIREGKDWKNGPDKTVRLRRLRERLSKPILKNLFARAHAHLAETSLRKTGLVAALRYTTKLEAPLRACFDDAGSRIDNNLVESAIRPLKIGAKNWLFIGHPDAGPTAAILFTLVENCRIAGLDPAEWLAEALVHAVEARTEKEKLAWLPQNYAARRLAEKKAAETKPPDAPTTSQN
jgi:transposase